MGVLQAESALAPIEEIGVRHKLRRFTGVRGLGADFPILGSYCNLSVCGSMCVTGFGRPTVTLRDMGVTLRDKAVTLRHKDVALAGRVPDGGSL